MDIFFGADYYPEHWPRERWETDAKLMREMGLDVVRMGEFSWTKMEPRLGEFDFDWLEEAVELLAGYGIKTVLGTPTATPPAWIVAETPEIFPMDSHGVRRGFGGRHHDCQSNLTYRSHIRRLVTAMAQRFAGNENVIGWQIDNELGNSHRDLCMCPSCTARFQNWLEAKYGDINTLNDAWGTCFWSQGYDKFSQIPSPKVTVTGENPSAMLDWRRFCSDLVVEFQQAQIDILRQHCPGRFITHNYMGFADKVNYFDLGKSLDFVSHDQYPGGFFAEMPRQSEHSLSAALDLMRGTKDKTFWIMEQQAGNTGWEIMGRAPRPGQLAMWATHSIAHGADTVVFFRWRTCAVGTEQYWHGILPHSGNPGRRYEELKSLIGRMRPVMKQVQGLTPNSQVGIVFSYDQEYALQIQPHHPDLDYVDQVLRYYRPLYRRNIPVDFVQDSGAISRYKLLIAPLQYLMNPALEEKYRAYVQGGGHLVLTMRTGVKDMTNLCMTHRELPGNLGDLLGLEVEDYDCLRDTDIAVEWAGESFTGTKWSDMIRLKGAQSLADFASEYCAGHPAVTVNSPGKGRAYYVGTEPGEELMDRLCGQLVENAGAASLGETPEGVEIALRSGEEKDYLFVLNHTDTEQVVEIPAGWTPVQEDQTGALAPFGTEVYTRAHQ